MFYYRRSGWAVQKVPAARLFVTTVTHHKLNWASMNSVQNGCGGLRISAVNLFVYYGEIGWIASRFLPGAERENAYTIHTHKYTHSTQHIYATHTRTHATHHMSHGDVVALLLMLFRALPLPASECWVIIERSHMCGGCCNHVCYVCVWVCGACATWKEGSLRNTESYVQ